MEAKAIECWLRRRARGESRRELATGIAGLGAGGFLILATGTGLAAVLMGSAAHLAGAVGTVLGRNLEFELHPALFTGLTAGVVFLLFAGNSRSDREAFLAPGDLDWRDSLNGLRVLRSIAGVCAELLYAGPRLWTAGAAATGRSFAWHRMDFTRAGRVLFELHCHMGRVPLEELTRTLPEVDVPAGLRELRLLRGVLMLKSPPSGVSLTSELRRQLGRPPRWADAPAMHEPLSEPDAEPPPAPPGAQSAKPPSFRCVECRRKFRLRNLRADVAFHCPLCGAPYRTRADGQGRVQIEHHTGKKPEVPLAELVRPAGCHAVLGVAADASPDEIKQAYRRLMKEHHPDRAAGMSKPEQTAAEERSKEINRAYAQLLGRQ